MKDILMKYRAIMQGTIGICTEQPSNISVKSESTNFHRISYRKPCEYIYTVNKDVVRLLDVSVPKRCETDTEWDYPCFNIPNKNDTVRLITNYIIK